VFDGKGEAVYPERPVLAFASIDPAYTEKDENDETACTVWFVYRDDVGRERVLLRYGWKDRLEFNDLIERIKGTISNFGLTTVVVEAKANGLSVIQELRRQRPEVTVHAWTPKGDKINRAHAVAPILSQGLVSAGAGLEEGVPKLRPWAAMVVDECARFPFAAHDDVADSVTQALQFIRASGFEFFGADAPAPPPIREAAPLY
jgi:predicted phage terminase large subunit-like protein